MYLSWAVVHNVNRCVPANVKAAIWYRQHAAFYFAGTFIVHCSCMVVGHPSYVMFHQCRFCEPMSSRISFFSHSCSIPQFVNRFLVYNLSHAKTESCAFLMIKAYSNWLPLFFFFSLCVHTKYVLLKQPVGTEQLQFLDEAAQ